MMNRPCLLLSVGLIVALAGCAGLEPATSAAKRAEEMATAGDVEGAIELVEKELEKVKPGSEAEAVLEYSLGWLRFELGNESENRIDLWSQAAEHYGKSLYVRPENLATRLNLAFVLSKLGREESAVEVLKQGLLIDSSAQTRHAVWLALAQVYLNIADYHVEQESEQPPDRLRALKAFDEAFRIFPGDETAPLRMVDFAQKNPKLVPDPQLLDFCRRFEQGGSPLAAMAGLVVLMKRRGELADTALESWVTLAATRDELAQSVSQLREDWPESKGWEALDDVEALVNNPTGEDPKPAGKSEDTSYWTASVKRRHVFALAIQASAEQRARDVFPLARREDIQEIVKIYERGLSTAASTKEYSEYQRNRPADEKLGFDVGLDIAMDLAVLCHENRDVDSDFDDRFEELMRTELSLETFETKDIERTQKERLKYYGLHSLVLSRKDAEPESVISYLENAIEATETPDASLHVKLAELLAEDGRPIEALDAYLKATRSYLEVESPGKAADLLPAAQSVAETARAEADDRIRELENLINPWHGFYVGVSGGLAYHHDSNSSLSRQLRDRGHTDVDVDLDEVDFGFKAYGGYRFDAPFALELGYAHVGASDSDVTVGTPNLNRDLQGDVSDAHPLSGHGMTFGVQAFPYEGNDLAVTMKLGGWLWFTTNEVDVNGREIDLDEEGIGLLIGAGLQYRLSHRLLGRLEFERYFFERYDFDEGVDLWTIGLAYMF